MYVKELLNPVEHKSEIDHELIGVCLNCLDKNMHIFLVYRPPHQLQDIDDDLYHTLSTLTHNRLSLVMGDFNGAASWEEMKSLSGAEGQRIIDFVNTEFLYQWVDKPTRGNNILDLVLSTEDNLISDLMVGEKLGNSDHSIIRFCVNIPYSMEKKMHQKLNFRLANYSRLRSFVENLVYLENGDIDTVCESFTVVYIEKQEACIPYKNMSVNGNPQPKWFNRGIATKISERNKAHKLSVQKPSLENETKHKKNSAGKLID